MSTALADNPAVVFYTRHGFGKVGERRDYYRGTDGVRRDEPASVTVRVVSQTAVPAQVRLVAGAEVLVRETVRRLKGRIAPAVFCLDAVGRIGEELVAEGVDLVCFGRKPGRDWKVGARIARAVRARDIEVVHAHQYTPFFYSALAKPLGLFRPKLILTEHGRHYPDRVSPVRRAAVRPIRCPRRCRYTRSA